MADDKWLYGKAVEDGGTPDARLRFVSVSAMSTADPAETGCLRKWHYQYILGKKKPKSRATIRGDNLHAEIEKYLKTGDRSLSSLALSGLHMVPDPVKLLPDGRPDMLVEHDMLLLPGARKPKDEAEAAAALAGAPVRIEGVPVLGRMDLIHGRGTNRAALNIEDTLDPPGTVEVLDWKTTGSPDWIKRPGELPNLIQMSGYAHWVYAVEPAARQVRLSHGYFVEKGGPSRKVTLRVVQGDVAPAWERAGAVVRSIRDAAREIDPDKVDANTDACSAYGGCPHREYCKARMHTALAAFVGQTAADKMLGRTKEPEMGLLEKMNTPATVPTNNLPDLGGMLGAPATGPTPEQVAAEKAKLEAEEAAARAAAQLREALDRAKPALDKLAAYQAANPDLGSPKFTGDVAVVVTTLRPGFASGVGKIADYVVDSIAKLEELTAGLDRAAAAGQVKPATAPVALPNLLSPETPAPQPVAPTVPTMPAATAPAVSVTLPAVVATPPPPVVTPPASAPAAASQLPAAGAAGPSETPADKKPKSTKKAPPKGDSFSLFVDCRVEAPAPAESLNSWLTALCIELAALDNSADIRCGTEKGPFAFGKWKGAIAAAVRERGELLPLGNYTLNTRGNEIAEIAAAELGERCIKTGGTFAWGRW